MRRLIAKIFGWKVVWLIDFDGTIHYRIARPLPDGRWWATRMGVGIARVILEKDGTVSQPSFVKTWIEA